MAANPNNDAAYDPAAVLKWLIKETGVDPSNPTNPNNTDNTPNTDSTGTSNNNNINNSNETENKIDSLNAMDKEERAKWMNVILGKTDEQANYRKQLISTIKDLNKMVGYHRTLRKQRNNNNNNNSNNSNGTDATESKESKDNSNTESVNNDVWKDAPSEASINAFVLKSLKIIHELSDQNELVLVKNGLLNTLFELILNENELLEIRIQSISILNDITQNNPILQNNIYSLKNFRNNINGNVVERSENGVRLITRLISTLTFDNNKQNLNKMQYNFGKYYQFRGKLWNFILHACHQHNPNLNVFLAERGYQTISSLIQKINKIDIKEELMVEYLRVSRLINYLLSEWSDCSVELIKIFDLFGAMYWFIYTLHSYLVSLLNETIAKLQMQNSNDNSNNNNLDVSSGDDPFRLAQSILDTLYYMIEGISSFMKRNGTCRRYVIIDNKNLIQELRKLNEHFNQYIKEEVEIIENKNKLLKETKQETQEIEFEELDGKVLLMQDICKQTESILRHVKRYENDRAHQMKMQNLWKKHHPQLAQTQHVQQHRNQRKNERNNTRNHQRAAVASARARAQAQAQAQAQIKAQTQTQAQINDTREIVLYRDPNKESKDNNSNKKHSNRKKTHGNRKKHHHRHKRH